jgi:membrane protease YdiL (CAAX protease family)
VVVASLLFGSLHLANYSGSIQRVAAGALLISAIGAVFGVVYERTRNLAVPIAVHALYNTVLLVTSYYSGAY